MSSSKSSKEFKKLGNNKQVSPARKWCFTFNNYKNSDIIVLKDLFQNHLYIFGEEKAPTTGTPHLQGFVQFKTKVRPLSVIPYKTINWEAAKGTLEQNYIYCSKEGEFHTNIEQNINKVRQVVVAEMYGWQTAIVDLILRKPEERIVHWYWSESGELGKSSLSKYLCVKHDAIILSGSATNMKNGILQWVMKNKRDPKIIVMDFPRETDIDYVSYAGIEEIKNGCFFSPKFEGGMCLYNTPHIIVLANAPPDESKLSCDRWDIQDIEEIVFWSISRF